MTEDRVKEDLEVFQKAYKVPLEFHKISLRMPVYEQGGKRSSYVGQVSLFA